jgi:sRNA-binding protein
MSPYNKQNNKQINRMKKILFTIMFATLTLCSFSQDYLVLKNGEKIAVTILDVTKDYVRYRLYNESNGTMHAKDKSGISKIEFQNGRTEIFSEPENQNSDNNRQNRNNREENDHSTPVKKENDTNRNSDNDYLVSAASVMNAQDIITKVNGEEINAKVLEINANEVKYRKLGNETGPIYTLSKSEIFMIKYGNGDKDVFVKTVTKTNSSNANVVQNPNIDLNYRKKGPAAAFWLSFLYPGIGQFYNGQVGKGVTMSALATGSLIVTCVAAANATVETHYGYGYYETTDETAETVAFVGLGVYFGTWLWSMIDAPISAKAINRRNALSWNIGNSMLSLDPDVSYVTMTKGANNYKTPVYGLSLKLDF